MTKNGLSKHFRVCKDRQNAINTAIESGNYQFLYHILVQNSWGGDYWLHMEVNGSSTLGDLDNYLKAIWLECCGHLSQFSIGGWRGEKIPMQSRINLIFKPGIELTHIYDFGSSSVTMVKCIAVRKGTPFSKHPIYLMARNQLPEAECMECEKTALWYCEECVYEEDESGLLCEDHVQDHPHDNYGEPMPLVNSPRVGICGYEGPADPPYGAP